MTHAETEAARARYEARYEARIRRALVQQGAQSIAAWEAGATPELAAALVERDGLQAALEDLYVVACDYFATAAYESLTPPDAKARTTKAAPPQPAQTNWLGRLKRFISTEGAQRLNNMVETTRQEVRKVLTRMVEQGQSLAEGARELRTHIATISKARAVTIVRTETVSASNLGSLLGAQATGLALDKFWISTKDQRTRPDHVAADGQVADSSGFFSVGGYLARYPGDITLPAAQVVRCRCTIGHRLKT